MGELVDHGRVLGEPNRVVHGQLVDHRAEAQAGLSRQRGQVDVRRGDVGEGGVLVLDEEVVAVAELLGCLRVVHVLVVESAVQG